MSFWGTLAGIGSSLIPGVGPFIAPLVGGVVNKFTDKGGGGQAGTDGAALSPEIQALLKSLKAPGADGTNSATNTAEGFYKTVLGGSQEDTRSLLGPDVDTILSQYDNAAKAASNFGPRGGGRAAIMAEAPFKKTGAYGELLGKAKQTAAGGLTEIGGQKTAAKSAKRGQDVGILNSLQSGKNNSDYLQFQKDQAKAKQYSDLGSGIGGFLTNLINGKMGKGKGGGGFSIPGVDAGDDFQFGG